MVQRRQLRLVGMGIRWILIWISFRNQLIIFLTIMILIQIRFLLLRRGRLRNLGDQYSCRIIFWFCLSTNQRFLFRWCNVLWRSCWQHLLFRRLIILGGIIKLSVSSGSYFINNGWFQIEEDGSWDVFSSSGFTEESVESIITTSDSFIRWHLTVRLNSVF